MKRIPREIWLPIALLLALILVTVYAAVEKQRQQDRAQQREVALSSTSSAPEGARALWLWLDRIGYEVSNEIGGRFSLPRETSVVLLLEPSTEVTKSEWQVLDDWVEEGGTLVLAGQGMGARLALEHYDCQLGYLPSTAITLTAQAPLLISPPLTATAHVRARSFLQTDRTTMVPLLAVGDAPVLMMWNQGKGQVILSSTSLPFSNAGLKEEGNGALALNVVSSAREPGVVWFDEWHHGHRPVQNQQQNIAGPEAWLRRTPAGRALLYAAILLFVTLLLRGRRLGRPVPLSRTINRRAPLEYVTAIANLNRRAGHRQAMLSEYRQALKRGLGKRYRVDPGLEDLEYVASLSSFNPALDKEALLALLKQLRRSQVGEEEMVELAIQVARWLEGVR